jgi:hypothetical protein
MWDLTNGTIGTITSMNKRNINYDPFGWISPVPCLFTNMNTDWTDDSFSLIPIDYKFITTGQKSLSNKDAGFLRRKERVVPFDFTYAYAITTHKAQGSEWDKVLVFVENWPRGEEAIRWLYTAITRAKEKVVIVVED